MGYQIVTNNPKVKGTYSDVVFVEGSFEDVLVKSRDFVHLGHKLINHPLGASLRMLFSPYRSIIIGDMRENTEDIHLEIIENSIENYRKHMAVRLPDIKNSEDYELIDSELLKSSLDEHERNLLLENG
ncbi:MAG: GrdX family protein [Clostridium sp.]|uniref:GrdX family protein n=1 Tax=Clostridium sp. TaxID=1506 RepID=UPI003046BD7E